MTLKILTILWLLEISYFTHGQLYSQCGGKGYNGNRECVSGLKCFKKDKYYAACLTECPPGWECNNKDLLKLNQQCGAHCGLSECEGGLQCLRKNETYSECLLSCPNDWDCNNKTLVDEYGQCGGILKMKI